MRHEQSLNRHELHRKPAALSQDTPYEAVFGDVSQIIDAATETNA